MALTPEQEAALVKFKKIGFGPSEDALRKTFDATNAATADRQGNYQLDNQQGRKQDLLQQADFAAGRQAPGIAQSQFRGNQQGLVNMLQQQAAGNGPSAANMQLKESLGRNVSTQQALLASGGNARAASQQAGQLGGSIAGQAAQARVQEQLGAQGLLSQTLQGARGQDLQRNTAISDMELRSRGLNDQQIARFREMELQNAQLGLQGSMGFGNIEEARRAAIDAQPTTFETAVGTIAPVLGALK